MRGSRPLTDAEVEKVRAFFKGKPYELRNVAMFTLGLKSGFRVSELLSLRIQDVAESDGAIKDRLHVKRKYMKKKLESRAVPMHPDAAAALSKWLVSLMPLYKENPAVFCTLQRPEKAITRRQAARIFQTAFRALKLSGKTSTHSWRKTFATKVYKALGENLLDTAAALGHRAVSSTQSYLQFNREKVEAAVLAV